MKNDKAALRRELRAIRRALSPEAQRLAAEHLVVRLAQTRWFRVSQHIACYIAADGEIDTSALLARIWQSRKTAYLPVLSRVKHDRLWFTAVEPDMEMRPNRFGIPEPVVPPRALVRAQALDLVLLPLVGFDRHGNRLGMGGGFYDRSLEFLRQRSRWRKPHVLGVAHECQRVDALQPNPWDVPLDAVVTDEAVHVAGGKSGTTN